MAGKSVQSGMYGVVSVSKKHVSIDFPSAQHEEELFADANNCSNALEEQYHHDILTLRYIHGEGVLSIIII